MQAEGAAEQKAAAFGQILLAMRQRLELLVNLPLASVDPLSIDQSIAPGVVKEAMIHANVIGCDLGPKITPTGSLETLLWLHVLSRKGTTIAWAYYVRVGVVVTVPARAITLDALALRLAAQSAQRQGQRGQSELACNIPKIAGLVLQVLRCSG